MFAKVAKAFALGLLTTGAVNTVLAAQLTTLHSFCSQTDCTDGYGPSSIIKDSAGDLFGASFRSKRRHPHWETFELKSAKTFKVLRVAPDENGHRVDTPWQFSFADTAGNLYGIATGPNSRGAIVEISRDSGRPTWSLHSLYAFCPQGNKCPDGTYPAALTYKGAASGLPYDGQSPLYGTAFDGGENGVGVVFELTSVDGHWSETVLYNFCSETNCTDGANPEALIADSAGNLFGTTYISGTDFGGAIFQMVKSGGTWNETVLHRFCAEANCTDGATPAGLTEDNTGNLYGVTIEGGLPCTVQGLSGDRCGVAYKLVPAGVSSQYTVLYDFCSQPNCVDGAFPQSVTLLSGNLYGTTLYGGGNIGRMGPAGSGVVFRLGSQFDVLHSFCSEPNCADGDEPTGGLVVEPPETVFGSTVAGGDTHSDGTVFRIDP